MEAVYKVAKYQVIDVLRSQWVFVLFGVFFALTSFLFLFGEEESKVLVSLLNLVLLFLPFFSGIFGVLYTYHSESFVEMLLTQPLHRRDLFWGLWCGMAIPFLFAFSLGMTVPFIIFGTGRSLAPFGTLLFVGNALILIFLAFGMFAAISIEERTIGMAVMLFCWLLFTILYDAAVLYFATAFQDYPLETPLLIAMLLNPIDLGRIILLMQLDISALMGYTGAVFQQFFGQFHGKIIAIADLGVWIIIPLLLSYVKFRYRDF